jgi:hypothetical protein
MFVEGVGAVGFSSVPDLICEKCMAKKNYKACALPE